MKQPGKGWWILFVLSLGIMIPFAAPYFTFNPDSSRISIGSSTIHYPMLVAHIGTAMLAMAAGFVQFVDRLRQTKPKWHRYAGRVYVVSVAVSGFLALVVLFYEPSYVRALSFLALDAGWLFTAWKGYRHAVKRELEAHRIWMIRSFGMTLVAVCARAMVPVLIAAYLVLNGFSLPDGRDGMIESILTVNIWSGLVVEFIVVEWMILRKTSE